MSKLYLFILLIFFAPQSVYSQLIDNRELPPEDLKQRPPFIPTDRAAAQSKNDAEFFILDNADIVDIQDLKEDRIEVTLIGNVRLRFDGNMIKAQKMILSFKDSKVINVGGFGAVEFTFENTKYLVESMNYQPDMERGVMYDVRSALDAPVGTNPADKPWFYHADRVTIHSSTSYTLDNVRISTSDARFPHYQLKAFKLWYIQGKVALAVGIQYIAGQTSFFWLPAFFQIENAGNLESHFGNERYIGYYFINNYDIQTKYGNFDFGFDFYERQGQFFHLKYAAPTFKYLTQFDVQVDLANDIRLIRNGNFFSQWVIPFEGADDFQRISQFAWHYKINSQLGANGINLQLSLEDLNDPFFLSKYSYRSHFDSKQSIDFLALINPGANSWYNYSGDITAPLDSVNQNFTLTIGNFLMEGNWAMYKTINAEVTNIYLNDFYDYRLRNLTLPRMSYNFGSLDLFEYEYKTNVNVEIIDSNGRKSTMLAHRVKDFLAKMEKRSNRVISPKISEDQTITNFITNWEPITVSNIATNDYFWFTAKLTASATASFVAQQTYDTNSLDLSSDITLATNKDAYILVADYYQHKEDGNISLNMNALDNRILFNNNLGVSYFDQWSTFSSQDDNNAKASGMDSSYKTSLTLNPNKTWFDDENIRTRVDFKSAASYSYPLYRFRRDESSLLPADASFSFNNCLSTEFFQWKRETLVTLSMGVNYSINHRLMTEEQREAIPEDVIYTNGTEIITNYGDIIVRDITSESVVAKASAKIWWLKIGTEVSLDILKTKTNMSILGENFTNRFQGGYPRLVVEFAPNNEYHYIPKLTYRYNLFEQSTNLADPYDPTIIREARKDKSYSLEFLWDLRLRNYQIPALYPFIYELSEFGLLMNYNQDFVNMRNSYLRMDFVIGLKFTKYLTFRFTSTMLNNKIYLYYKNGVFNGENFLLSDEQSKNFFADLWDGLKIWDTDALKRSSFKLQNLNFELIHDLDTWDMRIIFNLGRRVDEYRQVAYWEPFVGVSFKMKGKNPVDFLPEYERRFTPLEFQ